MLVQFSVTLESNMYHNEVKTLKRPLFMTPGWRMIDLVLEKYISIYTFFSPKKKMNL